MNNDNDPRHDPEGALLQIKALHRNGDLVVAEDADDEAREFARIINAKQADVRQAKAAQEDAKRTAGRYTLDEAAKALEVGSGERHEVIRQKLIAAAENGTLQTFEPGYKTPMDYGSGPGRLSRVRDFWEEVFWDDLNQWLSTTLKRVTFRFPDPSSASSQSAGPIPKRVPATEAQDAAILAKLRELGVDPHAVPAPEKGKTNLVKRRVQAELRYSPAVMNKAWTRLRTDGRLKDA